MKKRVGLLMLLLLFVWSQSYAYTKRDLLQKKASVETLKSLLVLNQTWVPYPEYSDREAWDNLLGEEKESLVLQGEAALNHVWQVVKATDYLAYERSGNRRIMEDPFGANNTAQAKLLMAELAEGKGRFVDQIINGVFQSCEMTTWVLSAHLSAQHSKRSFPDHNEQVIDLTSGDLGSMLAWTYYFFHETFDKINPIISERLRTEIEDRILDPYMQENRFWWMAFNYKPGMMVNNWNPWCNSNVLQCFLLLENDPERLAQAVYRTMLSVDQFINYTHSDGACEEGPSYWGHAAGKMYDYLQVLYDGTAGKISLFDEPIVKNMGEYIVRSYVGQGWVVNFADASAKGGGDAPVIFRYGQAIGSVAMQQHAAYIQTLSQKKELHVSRDILRSLQGVLHAKAFKEALPMHTHPAYSWYPETEFCYMGGSEGFFLAAKGGYNNESHNHNDAGTFSLYLNTVPLLIDAGVGTYTRQTFSSERYTIWTMQSKYHNLPMINGVPQSFGAKYKATNVVFNPKKSLFSANIATAYPKDAAVKEWTRSYAWKKKKILVEDKFLLDKALEMNEVSFLTWGEVDLSEAGKIKISAQGEHALLRYDAKQFNATIEVVKLEDPRLATVWGDEVYRLSLRAKKQDLQGTYQYTIEQL